MDSHKLLGEERTLKAFDAHRLVALLLLALAQTAGATGGQVIGALAPFVILDLGITRAQIGWLTSAYFAGAWLLAFASGWLADIIGVRRTLTLGLSLTGLGFLIVSIAPSLSWALVLIFLAGLGYSTVFPATTKGVTMWFTSRGRGTAMSFKQMGFTIGGIIAGGLLPSIALALSWRYAVLLMSLVTVMSAAAILAIYRDPRAMVQGLPKARVPQIDRMVLVVRNPGIILVSSMNLVHAIIQSGALAYLVLYLHQELLLPATLAGMGLALAQLTASGGRLGYGAMSDFLMRGYRRPAMATAFALGLASCLVAAFLRPGMPIGAILISGAFIGLGTQAAVPLFGTAVSDLSGPDLAGIAAGLNLTFAFLGLILGPLLFGSILDATGSYTVAWLILALLFVFDLLMLVLYRERVWVQRATQRA